MSATINFDALSDATKLALLRHVFEREAISTAQNNQLVVGLHALLNSTTPVSRDQFVALLNGWSEALNAIGERSDLEIARIVAGAPAASDLN